MRRLPDSRYQPLRLADSLGSMILAWALFGAIQSTSAQWLYWVEGSGDPGIWGVLPTKLDGTVPTAFGMGARKAGDEGRRRLRWRKGYYCRTDALL